MRQLLRPFLSAVIFGLAILSSVASVLAQPAVAQVQISSRAMDLEVSGRLQFQLQTTSCTDATPPFGSACTAAAPAVDMFLRRARFSLEATIEDDLAFKVEPDFSDIDAVSLKDAWGRYAFGSHVALRAGHFKRPFDGFHLTSSSHLPFERAVGVPGVSGATLASYSGLTKAADLSDRDLGFALEGTSAGGPVDWWLGVFTGGSDSKESDSNTDKQFVGRVRVTLDAWGAPLRLAGAVALTDAPFTATDGETEGEYFTNFELFGELGAWNRDGLLLQAGVVAGDNPLQSELGGTPDLAAGDEFASLLTWQGVVAYRMPVAAEWLETVTPLLRVSYADPTDLDEDEVWGFTPGLALYFHGRNRLALTWDVASFAVDGMDSANSFTAQMQFHF